MLGFQVAEPTTCSTKSGRRARPGTTAIDTSNDHPRRRQGGVAGDPASVRPPSTCATVSTAGCAGSSSATGAPCTTSSTAVTSAAWVAGASTTSDEIVTVCWLPGDGDCHQLVHGSKRRVAAPAAGGRPAQRHHRVQLSAGSVETRGRPSSAPTGGLPWAATGLDAAHDHALARTTRHEGRGASEQEAAGPLRDPPLGMDSMHGVLGTEAASRAALTAEARQYSDALEP